MYPKASRKIITVFYDDHMLMGSDPFHIHMGHEIRATVRGGENFRRLSQLIW